MAERIVVLSDKDKARKRINVFHGSAENHENMIKELLGNSIDIFKKNFKERNNNTIKIILHESNKLEFIDNASGIPIEEIASDGSPNYEAIFERAFCGSNFNNQTSTVGQNGIFLYTLSMTCEDIEYFIARPNGKIYNIAYHKGNRVKDLNIIGESKETYSRMIFSLDSEVWNNPHFTFNQIYNIAQAQASLFKVKIIIEDKQTIQTKEFFYEDGIEEYFNEMTNKKSIISDNLKILKNIECKTNKNEIDKIDIDFIFNYSNDSKDDFQKDFLNTADLLLHGTIQEGIFNGLKNSIDKWLDKNNKYIKKEKHITTEDISTGLNYICNVNSLYVEYDNQIKQKTSCKHYKKAIKEVIEEYLEVFFIENPIQTEKICMQVLINSRARNKANKTRQNILKKLSEKSDGFNKVDGLVDCKYHNEKSELHITEGRSALGSALLSRNPDFQACYPIRGKILNCLKASEKSIFDNTIVISLCKILNCGIELKSKFNKDLNNFDIDKLKFHSIFIDTDADKDGKSIQVLLLTMIYKLMPQLLTEGRIFISQPPIYVITNNEKKHYAFNDEEKDEIASSLKGKIRVNYLKGLGEMDKIDMYNTVLNPETRKAIKVNVLNIEEMVKQFDIWMDTDVEKRKEFIVNNLYKYITDND
ncbi:hypothetical protein EJM73_08385 [Clostridium botulinum]|uniref:toprim domain-containing protein n=1 Tax=Clostridium botulinum TaxID=1491 RepID=UPI001375A6FF|nr:toprim domain-containing protein [Clostridium botulinum]NCI19917.1 hypothetical protein [Clostridium botulinum]NCI35679.1 hypothetical protein [Clostridium botulinum]NCI71812.1 hypothetical protein [Clostridium botulinum]NDI38728.1 hypothetical protein [Clostridium botulinum]HCL4447080.1 hypothetical protein [Clostridium botulinum]